MDDNREIENLIEELHNTIGDYELQLASLEEVRTGSVGGHDPDFLKLNKGLRNFWMKKARTHPHPFTFCVRHLTGKVRNPKRLCAWLKDQALGTTKWRKGRVKESFGDVEWHPSTEDLKGAIEAFIEAKSDINNILMETIESYEETSSAEQSTEAKQEKDMDKD